jgi:hypothetical protein
MTGEEKEQPTLLDHTDVTRAAASGGEMSQAIRPWYFVSNSLNLLHVLSAGLIEPAEAFEKHYQDVSGHAPQRIALIAPPFGEGVVAEATSEPAARIPVALEVALEAPTFEERVPTYRDADDAPPLVVAPATVIPLRHIVCIHFRLESERDEFVARLTQYSNVVLPEVDLRCSPELFGGLGSPLGDALQWLQGLPQVAADLRGRLRRRDRIAGGLFLVACVTPPNEELVEGLARLLAADEPTAPQARDNPAWLVPALVNVSAPGDVAAPRADEADTALLSAVLHVLIATEPSESWRPRQVLADCGDAMYAAVGGSDDATVTTLQPQIDYIDAILRNDVEFDGFRKDKGNLTLKALLMVLMRPDPERLTTWAPSVEGAGSAEQITAAFLCGALHGISRMPASLRGLQPPSLQLLVSEHAAAFALKGLDLDWMPECSPINFESAEDDAGSQVLSLTWADRAVFRKSPPLPSLFELLHAMDFSQDEASQLAIDLCRELDLTHLLVERRLWWLSKSNLPKIRAEVQTVNRKSAFVLEIVGRGDETTFSLVSADAFLIALAAVDMPAEIEADYTVRALAVLRAGGKGMNGPDKRRAGGRRVRKTANGGNAHVGDMDGPGDPSADQQY